MRILVDTGVFSASISRRRRARFEPQVGLMAGNQIFLAAVTVAELRYGALVAGWGDQRRQRLEQSITATTVVVASQIWCNSDGAQAPVVRLRGGCDSFGGLVAGGVVGMMKLVAQLGEVPGDGWRVGEPAPAA